MSEVHLEGGCHCGHVRYRMLCPPMVTQACHCNYCRRLTGAPFAVKSFIERSNVELLCGQLHEATVSPEGSFLQRVASCSQCYSHLWSIFPGMDGGVGEKVLMVWVGTLDNPERLPPQAHIYVQQKLSWIELPKEQPAFEDYYPDNRMVWSTAALARRAALSP